VDNIKAYYKFILLIFVGMPVLAYSQKNFENAHTRAIYEFLYKTNPEQTEFIKSDLMYLDIGENVSKFYSRYEQVRDSIGDEGLRKSLSPFEINELRRGFARGTRPIYYNFQKKRKTTVTSNFSFLFTYYNESRQMPEWEIGDETKVILGYTCQKATANYLGREWIVFFTPEIPINQGPWKLWGLPGLIVQAMDADNFFNFTLKGFEQLKLPVPIIFIHKTYDGKEYEKKDKEKFQQMEKMYYSNREEFMSFFLGMKLISSATADGRKIERRAIPYIPLEPY